MIGSFVSPPNKQFLIDLKIENNIKLKIALKKNERTEALVGPPTVITKLIKAALIYATLFMIYSTSIGVNLTG